MASHFQLGWLGCMVMLVLGAASEARAADENVARYGDLPSPPDSAILPNEQNLELELIVNGSDAGFTAPVSLTNGRIRLRLVDLRRAGLHVDAVSETLFLDEMPGVSAHYDQGMQRLLIQVPAGYLPAQMLGRQRRRFTPARQDTGALFNYDVYVSGGRGTREQASLFHEARAFGPMGTFSMTGLVRSGHNRTYTVYDLRFRHVDEASATTVESGDLVTRSLSWAPAVRLGGFQISRDFSVRPDIITYPLPRFAGSAALPSAVELLVNKQQVADYQVNPGPFALDMLSPINGAGEASLIVTDIHGRSVQTVLPFYVSSDLLAPGLTDYSAAFGVIRQNYGLKNFDYGRMVGTASFRHGVSPGITLEGRAEISEEVRLAGGGAVVKLGNAGIVSGSYSRSFTKDRQGAQLTFGYEYQAQLFSLALRHSRQSAEYVDLGVVDATNRDPARSISSATLALTLGPAGSLGLGYFDVRHRGTGDTRFANASWSLPLFAGARMNASATRQFKERTWSGALTISIPLGSRGGTLSAGMVDAPHATRSWRADVARPVPTEGGLGWSAGAAFSERGEGWWRGDIVWRTDPIQLRAGAYGSGDGAVWAGASGSLVLMDGEVFTANRVSDAFVVVSTDGVADIPVRYENQLVGRTNNDGKLLIPWASAYYSGRYEIDALSLPPNFTVPTVVQNFAVATGGGAVVRFPIERHSSAHAILKEWGGSPLAPGTPVIINGAQTTYVGWDGLLFIEQALAENSLSALLPDGRQCSVVFSVSQDAVSIVDIGELRCTTSVR